MVMIDFATVAMGFGHRIPQDCLCDKFVAFSGDFGKTEKDINTLLSSVLQHIKMGWDIKLNVALG